MKPLRIGTQLTIRDGQSLSRYLNDINKIPLISMEEEVKLAARIRDGDHKAFETLVTANLRFVISVAKQYGSRGLKLHDLINEGNLGLVRAATRFDETRGFRFISFAVWWIRQGIMQALAENARIVRLPLNKINAINKIRTITAHFEQSHQRLPTADEIAQITEISLKEIQACLNQNPWHLSMDETLKPGEEGGLTIGDKLASDETGSQDAYLIKRALTVELNDALNLLSFREKFVIKMLYGIGVDHARAVDEVADELQLSSERVRQIKIKALIRLQKSSKSQSLREFLE